MTVISEMTQLKKGTRKPHKCGFCGRKIPVGYRAYTGVIDILIQDPEHWLTEANWKELKKTELKKEDTKC